MADVTVTQRSDGSVALDWPGGPFVVLTREKWSALLREVRAADKRNGK